MSFTDGQFGGAPTAWGRASGPRAGFWIRVGGSLIDGLILAVVEVALQLSLKGAGDVLAFFVQAAYVTYFIGSAAGQTPGQRAVGIRVISYDTGESIGYNQALVRWFVAILSGLCIFIGYLWAIWDNEHQTWHDKAVRSIVVPVADYPISR